jgi:RNA polymerase sigma-70 factor (ECF subfamily)
MAEPRPDAVEFDRAPTAAADLEDVQAAQADRRAFDRLYRRYVQRVYSYAFYQLGDHHDAEDVTERTFLAALAAIDRFDDAGGGFRAWLFRIAHNQIVSAQRTRHRRRTEPIEDAGLQASVTSDPARIVARADEVDQLRAALGRLPADRRQVILLRFVDELTAREIGVVLDRSEGAVRVLLHRALSDLARQLGHVRGERA